MRNYPYPASLACQVRSSIRIRQEMPYQQMAKILRKEVPYCPQKHQCYFLAFFEECYPSLIKKFMKEQDISRQDILDMFYALPDQGEKEDFAEALERGEF